MDIHDTQEFESDPSTPAEGEASPSECYRGAGAGQKESPYANSPYQSFSDAEPQPDPEPEEPSFDSAPPAQEPRQKKSAGTGKKVGACVLAAALVAGSCGLTAWGVNAHWENRTGEMAQSFQQQISDLQSQISRGGTGVSGSAVSSGSLLSPSQVYAQNVNSVVSITNQVYASTWNGQVLTTASTGSGFVLTADGYIISNCHVVENAEKLLVTTYDGTEYEAKLVGYDKINDISLLKVEAADLTPVTIGSSDELVVGDMVVAIGNPLGHELSSTQTVGYVSGKDRSVATDGSVINMLQTDAAINPGNSGGPLFNMRGEVVGITTAKYSGNTSSGASIEGIGFAIPIDDVMGMINDFKDYGYLKDQAYLGVTVRNLDPATASMYSLPVGSYVETVTEGSCAETAGIQPKDIIIAVGDYEVTGNAQLTTALRRFSAGDTSTITVFRAGEELKLPITFDEKPQQTPAPSEPLPGEMPENGSYDEWYEYFAPFFKDGN